ncbi:hypothetical protein LWI28_007069 [Acer negundo]|uniref:Chromo domain-containing protein n=1 Tax=Acer negundo TaxID=4023 RepID=A0AAD5NWN2_ACENE|nr:hypothetical protein LWI28_007069 [Acer negundo]
MLCGLATKYVQLHNVFHVLVLRKYMVDLSHVLDYQPIQISQDMTYEEHPLKILDWKQQVLKTRVFSFVKVHWRNHPIEEATWEREKEMKEKYPQLFETQDCNKLFLSDKFLNLQREGNWEENKRMSKQHAQRNNANRRQNSGGVNGRSLLCSFKMVGSLHLQKLMPFTEIIKF